MIYHDLLGFTPEKQGCLSLENQCNSPYLLIKEEKLYDHPKISIKST